MYKKQSVVVFAPHPDDETFGCGGTIAKKISEGHEVCIVVMTDGRYSFKKVLSMTGKLSLEEIAKIRREEIKRAVRILGITENSLIFLDFLDGALEDNLEEAWKKVTKILQEKHPSEVYVTYKKDWHPDHRATYRIVRNAILKLGISPILYQYSIAHRFGRIGRFLDFLLCVLHISKERRICVDVSTFLDIKRLAISEFKSQITIISNVKHKPVVNNLKRFIKGKEIFYVDRL